MSWLPLIHPPESASGLRFPPIEFFTETYAERDVLTYTSRIAQTDLQFDRPIPVVDAKLQGIVRSPRRHEPMRCAGPPDIIGSGWIGQALQGFRCWLSTTEQCVRFDDGPGFRVSTSGNRVDAFDLPADTALRDELLLGPALMLALSSRGIFGLHASAILCGSGAVLLLGPSGSGKSSMARYAKTEGSLRLTDDVSPVVLTDSGARVLPRFPQLKLSPALFVDDLDLPLAALVWVEIGEGALTFTQLSQTEASRRLMRDSVAARLFRPEVLARHLDFCAALALRTPAWRLCVPRVAAEQQASTTASAYQLLRAVGLP